MAQIIAIIWVVLLLGHFHLFKIIKAHHEIIKAQIKNGGEIIELNWKRTEQHLVNTNLPVLFVKKNIEPELAFFIMQDMGEVVTYQDVEKSSAVVYVTKEKFLYGVIDTRFYIRRLPFDEQFGPNLYIEVGQGHVFRYNDNENEYECDNDSINEGENHESITADEINDYANSITNSDEKNRNEADYQNYHDNILAGLIDDRIDENAKEYYEDISAKLSENEANVMSSISDSSIVNENKNRNENEDTNEYEKEIEDGNLNYYNDILAELTDDEINIMNSIFDSTNEIRNDEKNHNDMEIEIGNQVYHDCISFKSTEDETNKNEEEYQKYCDDILAKLSENEANVMNPVLDSSNENENGNRNENKDRVEDRGKFINKNLEHYDDILSVLTEDEINIVNSILDSTNTPSIPGQFPQHGIQQNVDHNRPSTSAQVPKIGPACQYNKHEQFHQSKRNIFYSEILIFVGNDVIVEFTKQNSIKDIQRLIIYYIVYFNAIDMLFAKLATNTEVMHINIAGLVLEYEPGAFPNDNAKSNQRDSDNTPQQFYADKILFKFTKYMNRHKKTFSDDSFDFFFLSTNRVIRKEGEIVSAYSRSSPDLYIQRRRNTIHSDFLGSVVNYKKNYHDYIVATRAIAELLRIEYDPPIEEPKINNEKCFSIMQRSETHCQNDLRWSKKSQNDFIAFFRSNRNRCFLLNYPRSLRPFGNPAVTINPEIQCECYGDRAVDRKDRKVNPFNGCHKQLKCSHFRNKMSPLPIDGTPCDNNKVCWRKRCISLYTTGIFHQMDSSSTLKRLLLDNTPRTDKIAKKSRLSN